MKRTIPTRLFLVTALSVSVGLAAEMSVAFADSPKSSPVSVVEKKKRKKVTVKIFESDLGSILVNSKGFTLYTFDADGTNIEASACTGSCASVWPPAKASGKLKVGKGLDPTMLVKGVDGQLAYNSHLLYTYGSDTVAGETNGNGVGGVWHAIGSDGQPLP